jgi:predicted phage terminase large subunit-like protein
VSGPTMRIKLHQAQADFHDSSALYRGFVGGRGAGKSFIGAYDLLKRAKGGRLYGAYAPSYPMMRDATLRTFLALGDEMHFIREFNKSDMRITLGNGAEVLFRSLDDPERARGPNLSGAWIDEASLVPHDAYTIIIACLREAGEQGWLSATFTPKGKQHWTYEVFGQPDGDKAQLFHAKTLDNPFLPATFYEAVRSQYTATFAMQELEGAFVDLTAGLARREWFPIVDIAPADAPRVRAWDFAATEKSAGSSDPDWTVGTLLAMTGGVYYVVNVIRQRVGPGAVEALVKQTAQLDGYQVPIILEQEPGSSGKLFTAEMVKALAGWNIRAESVTGDKVTRAMPFIAQAEAGNVRLVRGAFCGDLLDELCAFPIGAHDDQVDATSLAFSYLSSASNVLPQPGRLFVGGRRIATRAATISR